MTIAQCLPRRWGLTGPHPNSLSDLRLYKPCGTAVSLHRYAGRWVILRLAGGTPEAAGSIGALPDADFVPLNVVAGPIAKADTDATVVYDPSCSLAQQFPAIACPATFVIDPDGRLIAILDDHGWPGFLTDLLRQSDRAPAHGAIDGRDITR